MKKLFLIMFLFAAPIFAQSPKTVESTVCFQDPQANCLANGFLIMDLSQPATIIGSGGQVAPIRVSISLDSTGKIPAGSTLWANDQLSPSGTSYLAQVENSNGRVVSNLRPCPWVITGLSPIDLSQMQCITIGATYPSVPSLSANNAWTGNETHSGTETFTGPLLCKNFENVQCVDSSNSQGWAGSDVGAWINAAYANCPVASGTSVTNAGGCEIFVAPTTTGMCYAMTTPIVFSTNLKPVLLRGDPGGATSICDNQSTAYTFLTLNAGSPNTTSLLYRPHMATVRDINFSGSGVGNPTVAVLIGGTNGCYDCVLQNVGIEHFGTGLQFASDAFPFKFESGLIADMATPVNFPSGITGSGEAMTISHSVIANCTPQTYNIAIQNGGPVDFYFIQDDIDNCQIEDSNTNGVGAGVHIYIDGGHMEDPGTSGTAQDFVVQQGSNSNSLSISGTYFTFDNASNAHPELISVTNGTFSFSGISIIKNTGALQATHFAAVSNASGTNVGLQLKNTPLGGNVFNPSGSTNIADIDINGATATKINLIAHSSWPFSISTDNTNTARLTNEVDFLQADTARNVKVGNIVSSLGNICTNGELTLSSGWALTGSSSVSNVVGTGQTCEWQITTGTTTGANPTITDTLTNSLPSTSTVCEMRVTGGTGTVATIDQTTLSATAPVFTFNGTPSNSGATYKVVRRCGP